MSLWLIVWRGFFASCLGAAIFSLVAVVSGNNGAVPLVSVIGAVLGGAYEGYRLVRALAQGQVFSGNSRLESWKTHSRRF